jgi:ureidoacrylate peracid hydrolase
MKSRHSPKKPEDAPFEVGPTPATGWHVQTGRINLVRSAPASRIVRLRCKRKQIEFDLTRSALVVIDMQNDFCHPLGWFGQKGIDVTPMRAPIPVIARLLPLWRAAGGRVLWLNWGIRPDRLNLPPMVHYTGKRSAEAVGYGETSPIDRGRSLVTGDWGAQIVDELDRSDNDVCVNKHRLSGFWDNELDSVLRGLGIQTLFFSGVNTDRCVFSTLQDAGFLGYDCVLVSDACSTPSPRYVSRAVHYIVDLLHGFLCTSAALERAIRSPAATGPDRPPPPFSPASNTSRSST